MRKGSTEVPSSFFKARDSVNGSGGCTVSDAEGTVEGRQREGASKPTFSHPAKGVLVGLVGHPAHHVGHAHALLVRGARSHGVAFWER